MSSISSISFGGAEEVKRDMPLVRLVNLFFEALWLLVIVYVLGSWVPSLQRYSWFRTLRGVVDPMLVPFRRILPPENLGGLDLSPVFLMLALSVVQRLLLGVLRGGM